MELLPEEKAILTKLYKYCAYQDRCRSEVVDKLRSLGVSYRESDRWLAHLEDERFLDEERFARSFVRGKFYHKGWGSYKIRHQLRKKQVPKPLIEQVMKEEIDAQTYQATLRNLLTKKRAEFPHPLTRTDRAKVMRFLLQRGFQAEEIYAAWQDEPESPAGED